MPKDDPLNQRATLWLDRDANEIARERYFRAWIDQYQQTFPSPTHDPRGFYRAMWDTSWAAAVAVHSFITEGRLGPAGQNVQDVTVTTQASSWAGGWNEDAVDDSPPAS